jgi:DnaJ family protein C protein 25
LAYFRKYGANVLWSYAPQSNTGLVIVFILLVLNGFVYFAQYNKWKNVADRLAKAAVEDWNPSQGGTIESRELRDHAAKIWQEREDLIKKQATANGGAGSASSSAADSSNKKLKLAAREKKQKQNEELKPIIQKLAYDIHDFGAGFHKPTWKDLLVVRMVHWPYHIVLGIGWQVQFYIRRIQNLEWTDEEKTVMTERAVGHVTWELSSEQDRSDMIQRELWILPNLVEWKEQQEIKKLSKSHQKHIAKMKKKGVPLKDE